MLSIEKKRKLVEEEEEQHARSNAAAQTEFRMMSVAEPPFMRELPVIASGPTTGVTTMQGGKVLCWLLVLRHV